MKKELLSLIVILLIGVPMSQASTFEHSFRPEEKSNNMLFENFESEHFPPEGWTAADNDDDGKNWEGTIIYDLETYEEMWVALSYSMTYDENDNIIPLYPDNWLITPQLDLTQEAYALEFTSMSECPERYAEHYSVLVSVTGTEPEDFTYELFSETIQSGRHWSRHFVGLKEFKGEKIHIAFRHHDSTNKSAIVLGEVVVREMAPYQVFAKNIKGQLEVKSGSVGLYEIWVENRGSNDDTYQIELSEGNWYDLPENELALESCASGMILLRVTVPEDAELGENSSTFVTIRSQNNAETETGLFIMTTAIAPVYANHYEDFDMLETPHLPTGWSSIVQGASGHTRIETQEWDAYSYPNVVNIDNSDDPDALLMLITPMFVNDLNTLRLGFYAKRDNWSMPYLKIGVMDDPDDIESFTEVRDVYLSSSYTKHNIDFKNVEGGNKHIVFKHVSGGSSYANIMIDDVSIEELLPYSVLMHNVSENVSAWAGNVLELSLEVKNDGENDDTYTLLHTDNELNWTVSHPESIELKSGQSSTFSVQVDIPEEAQMGDEILFWVKAVSQADSSATDSLSLKAVALATINAFPYRESFEEGFPPLGWSAISVYEDARWRQNMSESTDGMYSASSSTAWIFEGQGFKYAANAWLASPLMKFGQKTDTRLAFSGKSEGEADGIIERIRIFAADQHYQTAAGFQQHAELIEEIFLGKEWTTYLVDLAGLSGEKCIVFNYYRTEDDGGSSNTIYIDDLLVGSFSTPTLNMLETNGNGFVVPAPGEHQYIENERIMLNAEPGLGWAFTRWEGDVESTQESATFIVMEEDKTVQAFFSELPAESIPFAEDFSGTEEYDIPEKWMRTHDNWVVQNTNNAGEEAPELVFMSFPFLDGLSRFVTPALDVKRGLDLEVTFDHHIEIYSFVSCTIRVKASVDGEEWENIWTKELSDGETAEGSVAVNLDHFAGEEKLFVSWEFDGFSPDIKAWSIDNIEVNGTVLETYCLEFIIKDANGASVEDATIRLNDTTYNAGDYVFEDLEAGIYKYTITKEGYFAVEEEELEVTADQTETVILETDDTMAGDIRAEEIAVFPNPATSHLQIHSKSSIMHLEVLDINGKLILDKTVHGNQQSLDIGSLHEGIYFLRIHNREGVFIRQFIIAR